MICFLCSKQFGYLEVLITHLKKHHGTPSHFKYKCMDCKPVLLYKDIYSYKRHLRKHSNNVAKNTIVANCSNPKTVSNKLDTVTVSECSVQQVTLEPTVLLHEANEKPHEDYMSIIKESVFQFTLDLHKNSNITRKTVVEIQNSINSKILQSIMNIISANTLPRVTHEHQSDLKELFDQLSNPFDFILSEHRLFTLLQNNDLFKPPKMYTIHNELVDMVMQNEPTIDLETVRGCIMPIEFQFRKYFESESVLSNTLEHMAIVEKSPNIENYINGSLWKQIRHSLGAKIAIPYFFILGRSYKIYKKWSLLFFSL